MVDGVAAARREVVLSWGLHCHSPLLQFIVHLILVIDNKSTCSVLLDEATTSLSESN